MGAAVGTGDGDSVNVELNVVPFIDLMSCLTAFLLVTAVWSQYAQIDIQPKGISHPSKEETTEEPPPQISVLLTKNELWIGITTGDINQVSNNAEGGYNWAELSRILAEFKALPDFEKRADLEVAAEAEVNYQDIVTAMDHSMMMQFKDINYVEPRRLSVRFQE